MTGFLTDQELAERTPSELLTHRTQFQRRSYQASSITLAPKTKANVRSRRACLPWRMILVASGASRLPRGSIIMRNRQWT